MEKICINCGTLFIAIHGQEKLCSDKCRKEINGRNKNKWAKNNKEKLKKSRKNWESNNKEKIKQKSREYYHKNKEKHYENSKRRIEKNKEKYLLKARENCKKHPEYNRRQSRKWYHNNKEKVLEKQKRWRAKNKDHVNMLNHLRREKERTAKGFKNKIENFRNRMQEIGECIFCGTKEKLTIEHLIPLSKGGTNEIHNLFPSCKRCNSSKHTSDWLEWYRKQIFYSIEKENRIFKLSNYNENESYHKV